MTVRLSRQTTRSPSGELNVSNPNTPGGCCVLGFHTYFANFDGTFPQHRFISQYASWISPGLFGAGFQDVTALSHELAESFGTQIQRRQAEQAGPSSGYLTFCPFLGDAGGSPLPGRRR